MYIKNISSLLKENNILKANLLKGNIIKGTILSLENGRGIIKLYDGTIIPAIFISENKLELKKGIKFKIIDFDEENIILSALSDNEEKNFEGSIEQIVKRLNIPSKQGRNIIESLIKFNLPASDDNILSIYKNISFIDSITNMSAEDILSFLANHCSIKAGKDSKEFLIAKNSFESLSKIDTDFLCFLMENDIIENPENILKAQKYIKDGFFLNKLIETIEKIFNLKVEKSKILSLKQLVEIVSKSPEKLEKQASEFITDTIDKIDIFKRVVNNYNIYSFNTFWKENILKNSIIIKRKYKNSKYINPDDVKLFIAIETPKLGLVESYVYKRNSNMFISFKVNKRHLSLFKSHTQILKKSLEGKGINLLNISIEALEEKSDIIGLSSFFNDYFLKELDVLV